MQSKSVRTHLGLGLAAALGGGVTAGPVKHARVAALLPTAAPPRYLQRLAFLQRPIKEVQIPLTVCAFGADKACSMWHFPSRLMYHEGW